MTSIYIALSAIGAAFMVVVGAYLKGQRAGKDRAAAEQLEQNARVQKKFNDIDSGPVDLDASLGRLRDRAQPNDRK